MPYFKIQISEKEKNRRRILYSATAVLLMLWFTIGFFTVYINCHNIIHADSIDAAYVLGRAAEAIAG